MIIEIISYVILWASIVIAIVGIVTIKGDIATHYDVSGKVDEYGSPNMLIIVPAIMLLCNVCCSLMLHLLPPSKWNMPSRIKHGCELEVIMVMTTMIVLMELEMSVFSLFITILCYAQRGKYIMHGTILFIVIVFATTMYGLVGFFKRNK